MDLTQKALDHFERWEGVRLKPYLDSANIPTIGIGFTYYPNGQKVTMNDKPLTKDQVWQMFGEISKDFIDAVETTINVPLNANQFAACVSLAYNIGAYGFSSSTVAKRINNDIQDRDAIAEAWGWWNKAGGKVSKGLENRRNAEINLFFEPVEASTDSKKKNSLLAVLIVFLIQQMIFKSWT